MFVRRPILHQETLSPRHPRHPYRNLCDNNYFCSLIPKSSLFDSLERTTTLRAYQTLVHARSSLTFAYLYHSLIYQFCYCLSFVKLVSFNLGLKTDAKIYKE